MGIKTYKPITPSLRWTTGFTYEEITKDYPDKSLTEPLRKTGGRNANGRVTCRHVGGGHKRRYRIIDFRRDKLDMPAKVIAIEYDPNRSCRIALVEYEDKERRYIICPEGLAVGSQVIASENAEIAPGNSLSLKNIPAGTLVHNVEIKPGKGGQIVRSAGSSAQIMAKEGDFAHLKLPSGEIRLIHLDCKATVGQIGNIERNTITLGKAGRKRWLGIRPDVRGAAMNPHDHPHGGGEGKAGQGNPHPVSPWGKPTKGFKTRKKHKVSNRYILKRRN